MSDQTSTIISKVWGMCGINAKIRVSQQRGKRS